MQRAVRAKLRLGALFTIVVFDLSLCAQIQPGARDESPVLLHIGAAAPDNLAIEIQVGRMTPMRQTPYRKVPDDQFRTLFN